MTETVLWRAAEINKVYGSTLPESWVATGLSIDTRTLQTGDLFFALEGEASDGHDYALQAIEKGAAAIVISKPVDGVPSDKTIKVENVLKAMEHLGTQRRQDVSIKAFGVTGSVGKTGTKEMLAHALNCFGKTHATIKSYNNHIGVPFMLSTMPRETQFGVFEMGMNHAGEITPLTKMVKPDIAIITTVGAVHMEFFDSVQKIADAKAEIFAGLGKGGIAVLNADNDYFDYLKGRAEHYNVAEVYSFGEDKNADACLESHSVKDGVAHVSADIMGKTITFTLNSIGKHIALNAMAVLLAVELAGLDVRKAARSLEGIAPMEGRGAKTKLDNGVMLIDESYNASPIAVKATIEAFSKVKADRHILCLGDMLELGNQSDELHQSLVNPIVEQNMSLLYCCGPHMKALYDVLPADRQGAHYENSAEMAKEIKKMLKSGDAVLVKGSLGSKMKMVVEAIKA